MTPDGPMTDMLAEYRRELARTRRADDWEARVIVAPLLDRHPAGPVWRWPGKGTPVSREEYGKQLGRACRRAGVPAFTPHQLRHLLATRVARHYQSLDHAAAAAVYVHLDPDERRKIDVARELG